MSGASSREDVFTYAVELIRARLPARTPVSAFDVLVSAAEHLEVTGFDQSEETSDSISTEWAAPHLNDFLNHLRAILGSSAVVEEAPPNYVRLAETSESKLSLKEKEQRLELFQSLGNEVSSLDKYELSQLDEGQPRVDAIRQIKFEQLNSKLSEALLQSAAHEKTATLLREKLEAIRWASTASPFVNILCATATGVAVKLWSPLGEQPAGFYVALCFAILFWLALMALSAFSLQRSKITR